MRQMITADEIREELIRQLGDCRVKAVDVARHLGIAPARVTETTDDLKMDQGSFDEIMAKALGTPPPEDDKAKRLSSYPRKQKG